MSPYKTGQDEIGAHDLKLFKSASKKELNYISFATAVHVPYWMDYLF